MFNFKLKLLKNFCKHLSEIILEENQIEYKINANKIILFILKTHETIKVFFLLQIIIFNFFSFLIYFTRFNYLDLNQKIKLKKKILSLKFLKSTLLFDVLHAIIILNKYNSENIKKIKIQNYNLKKNNFFENVVIGSGPGGSITAVELLKNKKECLMIEKGELWEIGKKKHSFEEFQNKWNYTGFTATLDKNMIQYASANCLGGGSEINSGLYHSISSDFLKKYNNNISKNCYDTKKIEELVNFSSENKNYPQELKNLKKFFEIGKKNLNWKVETIPTFSDQNFKKNSMSKTLINEYISNGGNILTGSNVIKLKKVNNNKYKIFIKKKKKINIIFCKNIFVSCGAPYSYKLLKQNNLINFKMKNFHFHPMIKMIVEFPKNVNTEISPDVISDQIINFYPSYIFGNAASGLPFLLIPSYKNRRIYNYIKKNFKNMTIFHSTFSFGSGKLFKIPFINDLLIKYSFNNKKLNIVHEGAENLLKFAFMSGAKKCYLLDNNITEITKQDYYNKNYTIIPKNFNFSSVHLLGGFIVKDQNISEFGKINNENIFINDSSLISYDLLKNPQGTLMALCKRNIIENIKKI